MVGTLGRKTCPWGERAVRVFLVWLFCSATNVKNNGVQLQISADKPGMNWIFPPLLAASRGAMNGRDEMPAGKHGSNNERLASSLAISSLKTLCRDVLRCGFEASARKTTSTPWRPTPPVQLRVFFRISEDLMIFKASQRVNQSVGQSVSQSASVSRSIKQSINQSKTICADSCNTCPLIVPEFVVIERHRDLPGAPETVVIDRHRALRCLPLPHATGWDFRWQGGNTPLHAFSLVKAWPAGWLRDHAPILVLHARRVQSGRRSERLRELALVTGLPLRELALVARLLDKWVASRQGLPGRRRHRRPRGAWSSGLRCLRLAKALGRRRGERVHWPHGRARRHPGCTRERGIVAAIVRLEA